MLITVHHNIMIEIKMIAAFHVAMGSLIVTNVLMTLAKLQLTKLTAVSVHLVTL